MQEYNQYKSKDGFRKPDSGRYKNGGSQSHGDNGSKESAADKKFKELENQYDSNWIKNGANESVIKWAEDSGRFMAENGLTSSKIRNIYGEIKRIQMGGFDKEKSSFYLLRPKVAYAYAREEKSKNEGIKLFKKLYDRISGDIDSTNEYNNFCGLIEAILAYHKAAMVELGKKDN